MCVVCGGGRQHKALDSSFLVCSSVSTGLARLTESAGNGEPSIQVWWWERKWRVFKGRKEMGGGEWDLLDSVVHHGNPGHGNLYTIPSSVSVLSHPTAVASGNTGFFFVFCIRKLDWRPGSPTPHNLCLYRTPRLICHLFPKLVPSGTPIPLANCLSVFILTCHFWGWLLSFYNEISFKLFYFIYCVCRGGGGGSMPQPHTVAQSSEDNLQ